MSDKNNNEQDQSKQDAEKKYSIDEENKYGAHGTEEDINNSFTGQGSADDNKKDEILNKDQDKKNDLHNTENEIYNENEYNQNSIKENLSYIIYHVFQFYPSLKLLFEEYQNLKN